MTDKLLFFSLFCFLSLFPPSLSADEQITKKVYAHLAIQDTSSACEEAEQGLHSYPHSKALHEAYIKALAKACEEKKMSQAWHDYIALFPEQQKNRDVLESMAWGVIENGAASNSPAIRTCALLAAFFAQDAKGVDILYRHLQDDNSFLRGASVQLSSHMGDAKLRDQILRMFKDEKVWIVRLAIIKALGAMKIAEAQPSLEDILANERNSAEEKAVAIQSLVNLLEDADRAKVQQLAMNPRAGLRLLACQVVFFLDQEQNLDLILPLVNDSLAEVRAAALETIGNFRIIGQNPAIIDLVASKLNDLDFNVAITAAWVMTLNNPQVGQQAFEPWLQHNNRDVRLLAASALVQCGKYGLPLTSNLFFETGDPYIRMNLGIGLIGQRLHTEQACAALYRGLSEQKERWMWKEESGRRYLAPSDVEHSDLIPNYPEAVNQLTRLEVLNLLALMKYSGTQAAIKQFLQERSWGISGMASAMLLSEGDDSAIELVQNLMKDSNPKIRIQAALILSMWDAGEEAITVLQGSYESADRETKEKILEGLGQIGSPLSIPFLTEKMEEPYQTLRIIAASSLLQSLYH